MPGHLEHGDVGALVDPEQRHDRVADPRADEALDDAALVGAKDDLELEPARAEERLDSLGGVAVGDQRQPRDLPRPDRPLAPRELRAGGGEEDVGIGDDADALEGGIVVLDHEGEVELAALEQRVQLLVVAGLDQPHLDVRPTLDVAPHRARQQAHADALERADAQRARLAVGERPEIGLRRPHRRRGPARVPEEPLPGVGRRHGAPAARPLEQLEPGGPLERRDLLADRRLGVAELRAGPAERARLDDRLERGEMADLDAHQSTMVSDRIVHLLAFYESVGCDDIEGMHRFDLELRVLLAFAFVNGVAESSLVPVLPSVQHDLGLSSVETGLLLTTTTLAMLVAAMPIGYAANRFGTRVPLLARGGADAARARRPGARRQPRGCCSPRGCSSGSASGSSG